MLQCEILPKIINKMKKEMKKKKKRKKKKRSLTVSPISDLAATYWSSSAR
jgi:hypothetical protein